MRKSHFTDAQIVGILKELGAGTAATELARRYGVHANTIRLRKDRYGGLETNHFVHLKHLEEESRGKDRIIVRLSLEVDAMKELAGKKRLGPFAAARTGEGVTGDPAGSDTTNRTRLDPFQSRRYGGCNAQRDV